MYLDVLHVFYTYPKRVQDTFWDTHQIHQDTTVSRALPWCHTGYIYQDTLKDTPGYVYLGLFITIQLTSTNSNYYTRQQLLQVRKSELRQSRYKTSSAATRP